MDEKNVAPKDARAFKKATPSLAPAAKPAPATKPSAEKLDPDDQPFIRAENEDDDGYDPYRTASHTPSRSLSATRGTSAAMLCDAGTGAAGGYAPVSSWRPS